MPLRHVPRLCDGSPVLPGRHRDSGPSGTSRAQGEEAQPVHPIRELMRVCSTPGCPTVYPSTEGSRCASHRKAADRRRGTASERGYTGKGHRSFRSQVLMRDPICVECMVAFSTVADHYPRSKRDLDDAGLNSNDPQYGRGLCARCHGVATAEHQPGGWNA
jgi:5-methylcytosine-specific restriction protein A